MSMVIPERIERKYEPYPDYKDSGVEWLGKVPTHWELKKLKWTITSSRNGIWGDEEDGENDVVCVRVADFDRIRLKVVDDNLTWRSIPSNVLSKRRLQEGDLLLEKSGGGEQQPVGAVVRYELDYEAVCSNFIACMKIAEGYNSKFLNYFHYALYSSGVNIRSIKQTTGIQNLDSYYYLNELIPVPDIIEQQAIADFLDQETARIDELIASKQRLIELLKEKRCALVHEAIQGSDTVNLRLGAVVDEICRIINHDDEEIYIPIGLYNWGRGIFHKEPTLGVDLGDSTFSWIEEDDLVLSGQFAWEGAVALAGEEESGCVASHRYSVLRGKPELLDTSYLFAFFTTQIGDFLLNEHSRGAAGRNRPLNVRTLLKEKIPIPPMKAQLLISRHVNFEEQFKKIVAESLIFLSEYRSALISATVTGKIDVRQQVS